MIWYFAYGSNMNRARLGERLEPERVVTGIRIGGRLDGWRLSFNKVRQGTPASGAANIVPAASGVVHGTLNQMPEEGLIVLDRFEGVAARQYRRETVSVVRADTGTLVDATTYMVLNTGGDTLLPLRAYLAHLLAGRDLLPAAYCAVLEAQRVADEDARDRDVRR
jgi:gamma-glutamylcyclotransferase